MLCFFDSQVWFLRQYLAIKPIEHLDMEINFISNGSISIPQPKEETLIRHSILGPNELRGQWQPPSIHKDNSTQLSIKDGTMTGNDGGSSEQEKIVLESLVRPKNDSQPIKNQEYDSLISLELIEITPQTEIIRQPLPPPVLVDIQLIPTSTPDTETMTKCGQENSSSVSFIHSEDPLQLHITHPTQSCYMSSIDIHTHYSYQIMLPEAITIVMAPKDCSRNHGIFRLTSGGMKVTRECPRRGVSFSRPPFRW